jgi:predicted transcriptional regulator
LKTKTQPESAKSSISFEAYFQRLRELQDRFFEREEFVKSIEGKEITWVGYVNTVKGHPDTDSVHLIMTVARESFDKALAVFGPEFRTKLFSLQKGDKVMVSGIYVSRTPNFPDVTGISVARV